MNMIHLCSAQVCLKVWAVEIGLVSHSYHFPTGSSLALANLLGSLRRGGMYSAHCFHIFTGQAD
jgi:hypothetical protein